MAKVTPVLWTHKPNLVGHAPIRLRFSDARRDLYASLGVAVHPRHWNAKTLRVRKSHPDAEDINALIVSRLAAAGKAQLALLNTDQAVTAESLQAALAPAGKRGRPACFLRYVEEFLDDLETAGKIARVRRERVVVGKLRAYAAPRGGALPFEALTPALLRGFEGYLVGKKENKASTVHANLGTVKNHYRRAIREGVVARESDPFHAYTPPQVERTERAKLSDKELAAIEALDLGERGPGGSMLSRVRDVFLFALYASGTRFGDVARLRRRNVVEEDGALRLGFTAGKTGKRSGLLLPEPAVAVLAPYLVGVDGEAKGPDNFLFPILDAGPSGKPYDLSTPKGEHAAVSSQNAVHNKYLKEIARRAGIQCVLTMHVARHSFADLARRRGWSVYDISKALRHSSLSVTERYLAGSDPDAMDALIKTLFLLPASDVVQSPAQATCPDDDRTPR